MAKKAVRKTKKASRKRPSKKLAATAGTATALAPRKNGGSPLAPKTAEPHDLGQGRLCGTETRGYATPRNRGPAELVLDRSEGFVPLWAHGVNLRWRFNDSSMQQYFHNPGDAKKHIRALVKEAMLKWGAAAPIALTERDDAWDFELVMSAGDSCSPSGCTLARAFFPDPGRHDLMMYPKMFTQSRKEQVDTFIHEIGHVFGLRHFFAQVSEGAWPSVIYGEHRKFSIMNYGVLSELTETDRADLASLYQAVWEGALTEINRTPVVLVRPFHELAARVERG